MQQRQMNANNQQVGAAGPSNPPQMASGSQPTPRSISEVGNTSGSSTSPPQAASSSQSAGTSGISNEQGSSARVGTQASADAQRSDLEPASDEEPVSQVYNQSYDTTTRTDLKHDRPRLARKERNVLTGQSLRFPALGALVRTIHSKKHLQTNHSTFSMCQMTAGKKTSALLK